MTEGRCGSCLHWNDPWSHGADDDRYTLSRRVVGSDSDATEVPVESDGHRWGSCRLIDMPDYGETVTRPAFTQDGSDYIATLYCRSDFGCVLYEPAATSHDG